MICLIILFLGYILGGKSSFRNPPDPFESGIVSLGSARLNLPIKFSLIAILFVIFDIEVLYLYIWALCVREVGWIGFLEVSSFILILLMTLFYLIKEKVFEWVLSE
nr:NADH-quinone oxidoreductase subunit A [Buchnera aphidicola]